LSSNKLTKNPLFINHNLQMKAIISFVLLIIFPLTAKSQSFIISGYIQDSESKESLIGATILDLQTRKGVVSNRYGFFSLQIQGENTQIQVSYIGYKPQIISIKKNTRLPLLVLLENAAESLGEIRIEASQRAEENVNMGVISLSPREIRDMPTIGGEADVLKALQWLPGVKSGTEGTAGLHVRGGSPDQNLMLLDGATVYNAQHLFGFISVFNPDALNNVELYKGNSPARYGGRISSVLDMTMREGDMNDMKGNVEVGLISSRLLLEGPIKKDNSSFLFTARRTYADAFMAAAKVTGVVPNDITLDYHFTDFNLKANKILNSKSRLFISLYGGKDLYGENSKLQNNDRTISNITWGNLTTTVRWNHLFNNNRFMDLMAVYSQYRFNNYNAYIQKQPDGENFKTAGQFSSGIKEWSVKANIAATINNQHLLQYGASLGYYQFVPQIEDLSDGAIRTVNKTLVHSTSSTIYSEDEWTFSDKLKGNLGLRLDIYTVKRKIYPSLQPRINVRYLLPYNWGLKAAFGTSSQFLHLLTNSGIGLPTDLWVPSTDTIRPQKAWQGSIGIAKTLIPKDYILDVSIEAYYKEMKNLIAYKEGVSILSSASWEDIVVTGKGYAKGVELLIQRKRGKWNGWIGYTLSRSVRQFPQLNNGIIFPYRYDRKHDISLVFNRIYGERTLTLAWTYGTGQAVTFPTQKYTINAEEVIWYGGKNAFRLPATHHLDLGVRREYKQKKRSTTLSIYNVYSHKNPFYVYPEKEIEIDPILGVIKSETKIKQVSIFPIIPTLSLGWWF